jgi:SAM-dependent methyltransferase
LLGAFLLFQVQPLIAKLILPWFGGSAGVWAVCLLFFQVVLLGGYAWAHWLSRQTAVRQKIVYVGLLALSLLALPILPSSRWKPGPADDALPRILGLLAATVGLPYFLLASTSPLLQSWRPGSKGPYRLYALSNAGALIGLLSYPLLVEPHLTNRQQVWMWSIGYCGFVAVAGGTGLIASPGRESRLRRVDRPGGLSYLLWIALAACASALLLAMTNQLTQNIAAMPFLWVLPLSLYLLSLILCFESDRWYHPPLFAMLGAVALPVMAYAISRSDPFHDPKAAIAITCAALFVLFMMCHGELARRRPAAEHLTAFYLMIAAGGAAGGVLIGLAAPYLFNALYDPVMVLSMAGVLLVFLSRPIPLSGSPWRPILMGLLTAYCVLMMGKSGAASLVAASVMAVCAFRSRRKSALLYGMAVGLAAGVAAYLSLDLLQSIGGSRVLARNFYGALAVYDQPAGAGGTVRVLRHGAIEHGEQLLSPQYASHPTTYYARRSGVGLALEALMKQGPIEAGVIGLGAGTLAAYARPGDRYVFYEINPEVIRIAQSEFTFLRNSAAPVEVIPGDARLSLEREPGRQFDLLAVDAFSGDVVPVHLLTREAFHLYWSHLKPDGVLAVHISSRYLSLGPVVAVAAAENQKQARMVSFRGDPEWNESASDWVVVTSRPGFFALTEGLAAAQPIHLRGGLRPWTDDYTNLLGVLR